MGPTKIQDQLGYPLNTIPSQFLLYHVSRGWSINRFCCINTLIRSESISAVFSTDCCSFWSGESLYRRHGENHRAYGTRFLLVQRTGWKKVGWHAIFRVYISYREKAISIRILPMLLSLPSSSKYLFYSQDEIIIITDLPDKSY